jgi:hypothetical protein
MAAQPTGTIVLQKGLTPGIPVCYQSARLNITVEFSRKAPNRQKLSSMKTRVDDETISSHEKTGIRKITDAGRQASLECGIGGLGY